MVFKSLNHQSDQICLPSNDQHATNNEQILMFNIPVTYRWGQKIRHTVDMEIVCEVDNLLYALEKWYVKKMLVGEPAFQESCSSVYFIVSKPPKECFLNKCLWTNIKISFKSSLFALREVANWYYIIAVYYRDFDSQIL